MPDPTATAATAARGSAAAAPAAPSPSARAQVTRAALLDAARDAFVRHGFTDANISDVVAQAGASVGTLYHHFGGKADLYLALFEEYQVRQEERASAAVREARAAGERDPLTLFLAGASAFLRGCWEERELARMFLAGEGPPGFGLVTRRRYRDWVSRNKALLHPDEDDPFGQALVFVLTTVASQGGHEVAMHETEADAFALADALTGLMARIGRSG